MHVFPVPHAVSVAGQAVQVPALLYWEAGQQLAVEVAGQVRQLPALSQVAHPLHAWHDPSLKYWPAGQQLRVLVGKHCEMQKPQPGAVDPQRASLAGQGRQFCDPS